MRYLSVVLTALLSLFILPYAGWAKAPILPPIIVDSITSQCINGVPTITVTLNSVTWGAWQGQLYYHLNPPSTGIAWSPNTNPATFTVPAAPSPGNLQITNSSSSSTGAGIIPSAVYPYTVATCGGRTKGMTWVHTKSNDQTGTITVGCSGCDPSHGDTSCAKPRPLLCIYKPTPPFSRPAPEPAGNRYNRWSGGVVATTLPVPGSMFANISDANSYCAKQFSPGWRVAEFHDGTEFPDGGWNFRAYGGTVDAPTVPSVTRFWVHINDQPAANCWQP